jgi:hypothetical protein
MRPLTDEETATLFEKLANYIGKDIEKVIFLFFATIAVDTCCRSFDEGPTCSYTLFCGTLQYRKLVRCIELYSCASRPYCASCICVHYNSMRFIMKGD